MTQNNRFSRHPPPPGERDGTALPFPIDCDEEDEADVFSSAPSDASDVLSSAAPDDYGPWPTTSNTGGFGAVGPANIAGGAPEPTVGPPAATRRPWLTTQHLEGGPQRRVEIRGNRFLIGQKGADLALTDQFVSPWHAQIYDDDGALVLEDMGSTNGVYLRIADDFVLEDRDEIVVGSQRLIFRTSWDPPATIGSGNVPSLGAPRGASQPVRLMLCVEDGQFAAIYPVGDRISLGSRNADIALPYDTRLAAPHASIERRGTKYIVRDHGSAHGTFIRVRGAVELIDGDCFLVGRTSLSVFYP